MVIVKKTRMTNVDGSAFANMAMHAGPQGVVNPFGQTLNSYDDLEFSHPAHHTGGHPVQQVLSGEAYKKPEDRDLNVAGFRYIPSLSTNEHAVYRDPNRKRSVIASRGTVPTNPDDISSDIALTLGKLGQTPRYKRLKAAYRRMTVNYPKDTYHATGHSLSAALSAQLHKNHSSMSTSTGFNGPGAFFSPLTQLTSYLFQTNGQKRLNTGHVAYVRGSDPVSVFYPRFNRDIRYSKKHTFNPHSLDQWQGY